MLDGGVEKRGEKKKKEPAVIKNSGVYELKEAKNDAKRLMKSSSQGGLL
jgi:hypothetical protein